MELKFLQSKSLISLEVELTAGRAQLSSFSCFRQAVGVGFCREFSSGCRGGFLKASCRGSNGAYLTQKSIASVDEEELVADSSWFRFPSSIQFSKSTKLLYSSDDEYGGIVIDPDRLPANPDSFASMIRFSLSQWKLKGKKGIWLKLPVEKSNLVPVAVKEGFEYHHAERGYLMLTYWIPEGPCLLPSNASHQVGVGGFVINDKNEVLVVQEKFCAPSFSGLWKIPTGYILESEEIYTGAVREVKEETGVDTEFVEVIAFRHAHNLAFEKSDLFFVCMLTPLSTRIETDDHEIQGAKWMPLVEFVEQPLIKEDGLFRKIIDICIARLGKRYCGLLPHQVVSKFDGRLSSLYYNVVDSQNANCTGS